MWSETERLFRTLCTEEGREGLLAAVPLGDVRLLPEQGGYLRRRLACLDAPANQITALALGMAYHPEEIEAVPREWTSRIPADSEWNRYVNAYERLNRSLNRVSVVLAAE